MVRTMERGGVMRLPNEKFFIKSHIIGSLSTIFCGIAVVVIYLVPSFFPSLHRLLVDDRIGMVIPYLMFIALGQAIFSLWYFLFRK
ncbi:MAG: hypothetical protein PHC49_16740 [Desulfuromonadaceae bacterium]|nr:hypothetical protein [Desulfuromonadaceae bacterium]